MSRGMGRTKIPDGDLKEWFGLGVQKLREAHGMKQQTLAHAVGYGDHSQIAKIEGGHSVPSLDKALRLATTLHVPLEMIVRVGRGEDVPPPTGAVEVATETVPHTVAPDRLAPQVLRRCVHYGTEARKLMDTLVEDLHLLQHAQ